MSSLNKTKVKKVRAWAAISPRGQIYRAFPSKKDLMTHLDWIDSVKFVPCTITIHSPKK